MPSICSHCHKWFEHEGKYCSKYCARQLYKQRLQIFIPIAMGFLIILFAIYNTSGNQFQPEPSRQLSAIELQKLAKDDLCPVCAGKGKVDCKVCIDGKIFYMGNSESCHRCKGQGWILCPACKGTGKLSDALAAATP